MKHSIRTKITLLLTSMVVLTILITWIFNNTFLIQYYMHIKEQKIYEAYNEVSEIFEKSNSNNLSDKELNEIEKLETKYDVDVKVFNSQKELLFPKSNDIGKRERSRAEDIEKDLAGFKNPNIINKKILKNVKNDENNYIICTYYDKQLASSYMNLSGLITKSNNSDTSDDITGAAKDITGAAKNITGEAGSGDTSGSKGSTSKDDKSSTGSSDNTKQNSSGDTNGTDGNDNKTESSDSTDGTSNKSAGSSNSTDGTSGDAAETPDGTDGTDNNQTGSSDSTDQFNEHPKGNTSDIESNRSVGVNDLIIDLRSNTGSITESAKIANEFLAYVGIIAAIIGSIAMFLITKQFTKPILQLSGIAKKMTDLEFEVKYPVKTNDEIGELGESINTLSDKLETTIMELKQANNELMTDIQRKIEIDEMRKEFLSNVSHELKTPIALIQGYAEGLKENINEDEESRDFYCEVIMDEANKMNNMVKKLLSLNELEFGNNQVDFDRFDIVTLIKSVINSTEILFKQKEVILHFEQAEPVYVWADELLIEQVVTNYISNALNHVDEQKIIEIKLIPRKDTVRVAVFNTGKNIPEDELDKVWIKFYKVDKARTREYGGSGIGLSIVKAIMNSHNKKCGAINRPVGVEFWFELDTKSIV